MRGGKPYTRCHGAVCGTSEKLNGTSRRRPLHGMIIVMYMSIRCGIFKRMLQADFFRTSAQDYSQYIARCSNNPVHHELHDRNRNVARY